jgi:hypothetical protein
MVIMRCTNSTRRYGCGGSRYAHIVGPIRFDGECQPNYWGSGEEAAEDCVEFTVSQHPISIFGIGMTVE